MSILANSPAGLYTYYASTYGSGAYDSSTYNGQSATSTGPGSGSSGVLTNTGFDIAAIVTIACVIALIAVAVRVWRRPKRDRVITD